MMRILLVILVLTAAALAADSGSPQHELVELRKKQAEELKSFYQDEAKAKAEQKDAQAKERDELLKRHRAARAAFLQEKHTAPERAEFFKKERDEMLALRARQMDERKKFEDGLKAKAKDFHEELRKQLLQSKTSQAQ